MSAEYGTISGRLTITIAGQSVDIGSVKVPMKGRVNGSEIVLSANLAAVRDTVEEILGDLEKSAMRVSAGTQHPIEEGE